MGGGRNKRDQVGGGRREGVLVETTGIVGGISGKRSKLRPKQT